METVTTSGVESIGGLIKSARSARSDELPLLVEGGGGV